MAKSELRLKARQLRAKGVSVKSIARKLGVAKSSASLWVRDIILSVEQLERLRQQNIKGGERGRLLGALKQKQDRLKRIEKGIVNGKQMIKKLNKRELLLTGVALYWAEGTKKNREVAFCNSDPQLIQFMIEWLRRCFSVHVERLFCYVGINEIHKNREVVVKSYWSNLTKIPLTQFNKTSFKKVINKKVYANFEDHYGTLTVKVHQPGQLYYDIIGLIEALYRADKGPA